MNEKNRLVNELGTYFYSLPRFSTINDDGRPFVNYKLLWHVTDPMGITERQILNLNFLLQEQLEESVSDR